MKAFLSKINHNSVMRFITIFILIQPFIDFITSFMLRYMGAAVTLGIIIRCLFLGIMFLYVFLKIPFRKHILSTIFLATFIIYSIFYIACNFDGLSILFTEVKGLIKVFYFPFLVVFFMDIANYEGFHIDKKYLAWSACIYIGVILLADITHTSFFSYEYDKVGHVGWFFAANEIGAIVGMLTLYAVDYFIHFKQKWLGFLCILVYGYITLLIGTKVPFFAFVLDIGVLIVAYAIKQKKLLLILIPAIVLCCVWSPFSNLGQNMGIHISLLQSNQDNEDDPLEMNKDQVTNLVLSSRDLYLDKNLKLYQDSPLINKFFGIGYFIDEVEYKLVEIDYADILIAQGIAGFLMIFVLAFYFICRFFHNVWAKRISFDEDSLFALSILVLSLAIALIAGHVFVAPSVSIFPALCIANCTWLRKDNHKQIRE